MLLTTLTTKNRNSFIKTHRDSQNGELKYEKLEKTNIIKKGNKIKQSKIKQYKTNKIINNSIGHIREKKCE